MANTLEPFYGCLCLETSGSSNNPLPPSIGGQNLNIPLPEIHFNIWEEGTDTEPFLDIGVMLPVNYAAECVEIFLPWVLEAGAIEDLSPRILGSNGVSAIFNEAWTSSSSTNTPGGYVTRADGTIFTIVPYSQPVIKDRRHQSVTFHSIVLEMAQLRTTSSATSLMAHQMYIRIRVKNVPKSFYRVGFDQGDAFGGGAFNRTEIIDFRLNVRRGVPAAIESILHGRFIKFSKVQLFLMKSRDQDIVFEDKLFKACRSLEDEKFWAAYILPVAASTAAVNKTLKQVKESLGYQWRKSPEINQSDVSEFGMLARFKSFRMKKLTIFLFVVIALVLGAAGNGVYDLVKWSISDPQPTAECSQACIPPKQSEVPKPHADAAKPDVKFTKQNSGKETPK